MIFAIALSKAPTTPGKIPGVLNETPITPGKTLGLQVKLVGFLVKLLERQLKL